MDLIVTCLSCLMIFRYFTGSRRISTCTSQEFREEIRAGSIQDGMAFPAGIYWSADRKMFEASSKSSAEDQPVPVPVGLTGAVTSARIRGGYSGGGGSPPSPPPAPPDDDYNYDLRV